jgi:hypothetical protein
MTYQEQQEALKAEIAQLVDRIDSIADLASYQAVKAEFSEPAVEHLNAVIIAKLLGKPDKERSAFLSGFWLGVKYQQQYPIEKVKDETINSS